MRTLVRGRALATFAFVIAACAALSACSSIHHGTRHDRTIYNDTVTLTSNDVIHGNLNIVGGHVRCDGATIDGDVRTYFGEFDEGDDCNVGGAVTDAFESRSALVFVPWLAPDEASRMAANEERALLKLAYGVIVLVMFLIFPMRTRTALDRVEHHPGLSALLGALAAVAVVPIAVLLAVTVIGIPLIPLEIAAFFGMLWIGEAAVALLIGRRFYELIRPHTTPSPLGALVLGVGLITAAELLPVIGWAVWAVVSLVGLGCALMAFMHERQFTAFQRPGGGPPNTPGSSVPMRSI